MGARWRGVPIAERPAAYVPAEQRRVWSSRSRIGTRDRSSPAENGGHTHRGYDSAFEIPRVDAEVRASSRVAVAMSGVERNSFGIYCAVMGR